MSQPSFAVCEEVLVIQYGDSHSAYDQIPAFLGHVRGEINRFKASCPEGEVVVIASGDISARSAWSLDKGWLNVKLLRHLSEEFPAVWVQGNHEGLDWRGPEGHELYIEQLKFANTPLDENGKTSKTERHSKRGIFPLAANLQLAPAVDNLIHDHRDIPLFNGKTKLRIAGFTLQEYFRRAVYNWKTQPQLFTGINDLMQTVKEQFIQAGKDGVDWFIPAFHEEFVHVKTVGHKLYQWTQERPALERIRVPAVFAADDHKVFDENIMGYPTFDSGCEYSVRALRFNASGALITQNFYPMKEIELAEKVQQLDNLSERDRSFIRAQVDPILASAAKKNAIRLGVTYSTTDTRTDVKKRRTEIGTLIADSFKAWTEDVVNGDYLTYKHLPVVALFNSSTYRLESPIPEKELTVGDIVAMIPYSMELSIYVMSGKQLQQLINGLRAYRMLEEVFSPQMSTNLRLAPTAEHPFRVEMLYHDQWLDLSEVPEIVVPMDHWLGENGYQLEGEWLEVQTYDEIKPKKPVSEEKILTDYLPDQIRKLQALNTKFEAIKGQIAQTTQGATNTTGNCPTQIASFQNQGHLKPKQ